MTEIACESVHPLDELRHGMLDGSTLPWVVKHAPNGDADAVLARMWNDEKDVRVLMRLAFGLRRNGIGVWHTARLENCQVVPDCFLSCEECRRTFLATFAAPTMAEAEGACE